MLTKEYIFVSKNAVLGGIETLMVRMANEVVNKGHKVTVVCPDGPVLKSLEQSVTRIPFNNTDKLEKVLQKIKINPRLIWPKIRFCIVWKEKFTNT